MEVNKDIKWLNTNCTHQGNIDQLIPFALESRRAGRVLHVQDTVDPCNCAITEVSLENIGEIQLDLQCLDGLQERQNEQTGNREFEGNGILLIPRVVIADLRYANCETHP
jgi:hypothetical protein